MRTPILIVIASLAVAIVLTTALLIAAESRSDYSTLSSITTYER